jgi:hypothetical protein
MAMSELLSDLARRGDLIPLLAIAGGLGIGAIAVVCGGIRSVAISRAREETKRELVAHVAGGTLDAPTAIGIIEAGRTGAGLESRGSIGAGWCGIRIGGARSPRAEDA